MILIDQEIEDLYFTEVDNRIMSFARAIEAAVSKRLATVIVEWPESASSSHEVYLREQIEPMLAAVRVQENERCCAIAIKNHRKDLADDFRAMIGGSK